jgi:hypothetical protein
LKRQFDLLMKKVFRKSTKIYNSATVACFAALFLGLPLSLVFWKVTGYELFRCFGLGFALTAVAAALTAFLGQSVNQSLRGWAYATGKGWDFFGQEEFVGSWQIFHVKNANITRSCNYHVHSNARSHRRASRASFTRASNSTGGTSDDDSGDPDPYDQLNLNTPSKFHPCTKKTNINPLPGRVRQYRRVPNRVCLERGRFV